MGGVLFTLIGLQYLGAGLQDAPHLGRSSHAFFQATVWSRLYLVAGDCMAKACLRFPACYQGALTCS